MSNETIYTFDSDDIYFLNDKNIVSAINENARINGIPSQVLFKLIYNELSSADKALSDIISAEMYGKLSAEFIEFKDTVETSCDNISTLIGSVSTDLSNTITTNSKHIDELLLSTELISGEVNRLCSEVSTDVEAKYSKLTSDDNFISGEVNRLCSEISNDIETKYSKLTADDSFISGEVNRLCSEISNDIETKYSKLTTDNSFISAETDRLCSEVSADVEAKYSELTSDDSFISGEVNRLCSEVSTDVEAKYSWLSNNIVTVSNDNTCYHQLSVIKIAKDEYDTLVADKPEMLSGNTLYIVDSDYMDAYGQVLCNLVMTNDNVPSDAANKHYVDKKTSEVQSQLNQVSSTFANVFANISGITLNSQLSDLLSATIEITKILSCFNI